MNNTINNRIIFLDYLRIFAFVSVLIGHLFYYQHILSFINDPTVHATPKLITSYFLPLCHRGGAGIIVFFMVSGYIITHVLQTESTASFIIRRIFRIYPLYISAVVIQNLYSIIINGTHTELSVLIPQLLLIGDFFQTPYTLGAVEWTLRVEVMFYVFMALLHWLNIIKNAKLLYWILVITSILLYLLAPIPSHQIWSKGYFTFYTPFLFLGVIFYLLEKKQINISYFIALTILILCQYFNLIATYQPIMLEEHFAFLGFLVFFAFWYFRNDLQAGFWVQLFSDLTYAVYLFHNWFFSIIKNILSFFIKNNYIDYIAVIFLFLFCYLMGKLIEKPGIKLGKIVQAKLIKN